MKKISYLIFVFLIYVPAIAQQFKTIFEQSAGKHSATYFQAIDFYKSLAKFSKKIHFLTFDTTDAGYPLHLVVYSNAIAAKPASLLQPNKVVILINNGIHPGEPDGIDASMMLLRDVVTGREKIPDNIILAFIPVYNIGGALNRNSFSRANQDGPESFGFRGNAQNLDLNRDFTKTDSKDAKAFAKIFHYLHPDILIDNHVSDGADYQYTMTLLTTQHNKLGAQSGEFLHKRFEPALFKNMDNKGWAMTPYVNFEESTPDKGMTAFYDPPRYSSGYAALFQTIAFMPETHMLKPFKDRVQATYALMQSIITEASIHSAALKAAKKSSIDSIRRQKTFPLSWRADTSIYETIHFKGYEAGTKTSDVSGLNRLFYDRTKPFTKAVKFYNTYRPEKVVTAPIAYVVPQGWTNVIDNLILNGVVLNRLGKDSIIKVEMYKIDDYKSMPRPYEKHHRNSDVVVSKHPAALRFLKGDYLIFCNQPANRYIVEMLEPTGDDGFFAWNYFDAVLQQKEGYSDYRWEDLAARYLNSHPELRTKLEERKKTDPAFAKSARAQLNFVYVNSPYYEPEHMRYPVFRIE